jgi:hypothetical protein
MQDSRLELYVNALNLGPAESCQSPLPSPAGNRLSEVERVTARFYWNSSKKQVSDFESNGSQQPPMVSDDPDEDTPCDELIGK